MAKQKITPTTNDLHAGNGGAGAQVSAPWLQGAMPPSGPFPPQFVLMPSQPPLQAPSASKQEKNKSSTIEAEAKKPEPQKAQQLNKVALIGTAPSSRMLAPYNDPSWTIWGCSSGNMNVLPRYDAWVEIHGPMLLWPENRHYGVAYVEWLKNLKCPVYMQDQTLVPNAIPVPIEKMVEEFGPYFFTSTFTWMMALAMLQGAKEIALYGIDMASRDEYILQRPGAYHFFHEAKRRGITITAPYESDILQPPALYGFSENTPFGRKLHARNVEIRERINHMKAEREKLSTNILYLEGAQEDLDYVISIWGGVQNNRPMISKPEGG